MVAEGRRQCRQGVAVSLEDMLSLCHQYGVVYTRYVVQSPVTGQCPGMYTHGVL